MDLQLPEWLFDPTIGKLVASAFGLATIYTLVKLLQRSIGRAFTESDTRYRIRKVITFVGYVAAALLVSNIYSDRLTGLTVAFGVAGAGIAFALQEVIASVAGWIAISLGQYYRTGERVELGGIRGDVIDIGVLRTTLMELGEWVNGDLYNGRIVRVANSFVFKEPVYNYSADFPFLWDEIRIPIHYGSDRKRARSLILEAVTEVIGDYPARSKAAWIQLVEKYRLEAARVEPMVTMTADENWYTFTARYVVDYRKRRTTRDQIFTRIFEAIEATEGQVQVASAAYEITAFPPVRVQTATNQEEGGGGA